MIISTVFTPVQVYPAYKSTPILEPKNKFFLFLGKNAFEKLIFYLRIFFQVRYGYTEKIVLNFFWSQFLTHV